MVFCVVVCAVLTVEHETKPFSTGTAHCKKVKVYLSSIFVPYIGQRGWKSDTIVEGECHDGGHG